MSNKEVVSLFGQLRPGRMVELYHRRALGALDLVNSCNDCLSICLRTSLHFLNGFWIKLEDFSVLWLCGLESSLIGLRLGAGET